MGAWSRGSWHSGNSIVAIEVCEYRDLLAFSCAPMTLGLWIVLLMLLRLALPHPHSAAAQLQLDSDAEALLAFKAGLLPSSAALVLRSWINTTTSSSLCDTWAGVTCSNSSSSSSSQQQAVVRLDLANLNLSGAISPNFDHLPFLAFLNLSANNLSGPIPASFCAHLPSLTHLDLHQNALSGPIPPNLSRCSSLALLDLSRNPFSGSIPSSFSSLRSLRVLQLHHIPNLSGSIPPSLALLHNLTHLCLGTNNLTGTIPPAIGNLSNLLDLAAYENKFSGPIPAELGKLRNLQSLKLFNTDFQGSSIPPDLGNLTSLQYLYMFNCNLSGPIPPDLGRLENLVVFDFDVNRLSGSIPSSLAQLSSLEEIHLYNNQLSGGIPPELGNLTSLRYLYLHFNGLNGSIPAELGYLRSLEVLQLQNNNLQGQVPPELGNLTSVQFFYIHSNQLTGFIPPDLGNLKHLREIGLGHSSFERGIPETFGMLESLEALDINNSSLTGTIPSSLGNLKNLTYLRLSKNRLSGSLPPSLANASKLKWLKLENNSFSGGIPTEYASFPQLETLSIHHNNLTGSLPPDFANVSSLAVIDLKRNKLVGVLPDMWSQLQQLRVLSLGYNRLEGPVPLWLWDLSQLQVIDLSNNLFQGSISNHINHLLTFKAKPGSHEHVQDLYNDDITLEVKNVGQTFDHTISTVVSLDLSNNQLKGTIPQEIGDLLAIFNLNLSSNNLEGSIPSSLGACTNIESLDLSINNLSGQIPSELQQLTFLTTFNVSYNNLTGQVPQEQQFLTFSNLSYLGNPGLCFTASCPNSDREEGNSTYLESGSNANTVKYASAGAGAFCVVVVLLLCYACYRRQLYVRENEPALHVFEKSLKGMKVELSKALQHGCYASNEVGRGGMSVVYKVVLSNGRPIVVKRLSLALSAKEAKRVFSRESRILGQVRHRNVLKLLGACSAPPNMLSCIFDFIPNKSLDDHLHPPSHAHRYLGWKERCKIAVGVAQGLVYLHNDTGFGQVLHLDLKPSNILLDAEFEPRISDFGISRMLMEGADPATTMSTSTSHFKGSIGYVAPEAAFTQTFTDRADVYSFGIILLELVTAKKPTWGECFDERADLRSWVASFFEIEAHPDVLSSNNAATPAPCWDNISLSVDKALLEQLNTSTDNNGTAIIMQEQVLHLLRLGLWCARQSPNSRPSMREVLKIILELPGYPPKMGLNYPPDTKQLLSSFHYEDVQPFQLHSNPSDQSLSSSLFTRTSSETGTVPFQEKAV